MKPVAPAASELNQFFNDYWVELKKYDPIVALLTSWGVFTPPPEFLARKRVRAFLFVIQAFLAIGLTVQLGCTRDPMSEAVVVIMTVILITIPVEILNVVWFRVVKENDEIKTKSAQSGCCRNCFLWTVQYLGKTVGALFGFLVFSYATIFFVLTFAGIHPGCSEQHRYALATHVVLFQFLLVPVLMSLPYWRAQSVFLSFLGQLGPVLGILMHIRMYGLHPPPPLPLKSQPVDVENPVVNGDLPPRSLP